MDSKTKTIMILDNTPIEEYKIKDRVVYVKREDMCVQPPGPPFSKCRGLYKHMSWLKGRGIKVVGYAESAISMAGIGVAWIAKELGMRAVIFDPQYNDKTPELLGIHREKWKEFGATLIPLPAGRTKINFYIGQKHLLENYSGNSMMLPIGLRLEESVEETAKEWERTMKIIRPDVTIVPVGSGTIFAGIIKGAKKEDGRFIGVMCYAGNLTHKYASLWRKSRKYPHGLVYPLNVPVQIININWEYIEYSTVSCPFPCHKYYDLKAFQWLVENINTLQGKILFWNIGKEIENFVEK